LLDQPLTMLAAWTDWLAQQLTSLPIQIVVAILLLPLLPAALSRRADALLVGLLLTAVSVLVYLSPQRLAPIVVIGSFAGALVFAMYALVTRRNRALIDAQLVQLLQLRGEVTQLQDAEQRRLLSDLTSRRLRSESDH
jgi:hypothetical protein